MNYNSRKEANINYNTIETCLTYCGILHMARRIISNIKIIIIIIINIHNIANISNVSNNYFSMLKIRNKDITRF